MLLYLPFLRGAGHRCDVWHSFPPQSMEFRLFGRDLTWRLDSLRRFLRHRQVALSKARCYDTIIIERELLTDGSWDLELAFRAVAPRLVLDVDDGIFLPHPEKFDHIAGACDAVIVGNSEIANYAASRCRQVVTIPTTITLEKYPLRPPPANRNSAPIIGWVGLASNLPLLSVAAPALRRLAREIPFRLRLITSDLTPLAGVDLTGVPVDFVPWNPRAEAAALHPCDIGIMPLPADVPWMRYKCGLKLLQYLAIGIPAVASPIGVNRDILAGQQAGFLAATDDEWYASLRQLLTEPQLRQTMGTAARELITHGGYTTESTWKRFEAVLLGDSA